VDDQRIFSDTALNGGWYPAPDGAGFANFSNRYRQKYGQDRCAPRPLSYDATALVAALVKTHGAQRFTAESAHERFGLCRDRRRVPLPSGRHE
jgi:hypothetical protein